MELDSKIIDRKYIFDVFNTGKAKAYVGKECYFSNDLSTFANMADTYNKSQIYRGILFEVRSEGFNPYETELNRFYAFCLPCDWVTKDEKKYRPYTIAEFQRVFTIGRPIRYRIKNQPDTEKLLIFNGYERNNSKVYIYFGCISYTLEQLFDAFEWQEYYPDDYKPFGIADGD